MSIIHHDQATYPDQRSWNDSQSWFQFPSVSLEIGGKIAMLIVSLIGLGLASHLAWVSLTASKIAGCGAGTLFNCNHVMGTKWSNVVGIPVSIPAVLVFLTIAAVLTVNLISKNKDAGDVAKRLITIAAFTAAVAAIWFTSLQIFVIEHLCIYCLATHACSLILAGLVIWTQPISGSTRLAAVVIAIFAVGILATTQMLSAAPQTFEIQTFETTAPIANEGPQPASEIFTAPGIETPVFEAPVVEEKVDTQDNSTADSNSDGNIEKRADGTAAHQVFEAPAIESTRQKTAEFQIIDPAAVLVLASLVDPGMSLNGLLGSVLRAPQQETGQQASEKQPTKTRRLVSINGGRIKLDAAHWPICGSKDATTIGVEMFDYTCPHCRATHGAIKAAMQRSNNGFAFLSLAIPMNSNCNPAVQTTNSHHVTACDLAYLSIAVWRVAPEKYSEYHNWLFTGHHAPSVTVARTKAESLIGAEALQQQMASGVPQQYVAKQCQLYQSVGQGVIPKMYIGNSLINGKTESAETFLRLINQN